MATAVVRKFSVGTLVHVGRGVPSSRKVTMPNGCPKAAVVVDTKLTG